MDRKTTKLLKEFKDKHLEARGKYPEYTICCTRCTDTRYRLGINFKKKVGHCFNCGYTIHPYNFLEELGIGTIPKHITDARELIDAFIDKLKPNEDLVQPPKAIKFNGVMLWDWDTDEEEYGKIAEMAYAYLIKRGFESVCRRRTFPIMIPAKGVFRTPRLVLPIFEKGELVSYQARALDNAVPKYLNPPKILGVASSKSNLVYNLDAVDKDNPIVICEGIFSAMAVGQQAVAVLGKEISQQQVFKILSAGITEAVIMFDPGAEKWAIKAAKMFDGLLDVRVAFLEDGDPNEVSQEYILEKILESRKLENLERYKR